MENVFWVNVIVRQGGPVKGAANQTALMHVTLVVNVCPEVVNVNLVGVAKHARSKNAQINVPAKLKVHVTRKHSNVHVKKGGQEMTAVKKHAQKTVTATANVNQTVCACAKTCGLVKAVNFQPAQIHAAGMACVLGTNVNATLNSKAMIVR